MKLKSQLRRTPLERLQEITLFWDLHPNKDDIWESADKLAQHLYPRLQTANNFKQAFDKLEVSEREVVYFLTLHGGELPRDEFRRRTGLHTQERFEPVMDRLNRRGFIWEEAIRDDPFRFKIVGVPEPFVRLIDLPPYWKGFLGYFLQAMSLDELKAIARSGVREKYDGRKKQVLVHFLREQLLEPERLREIMEGMEKCERETFRQILQKNGACVWRDLLDEGVRKKFNHQKAEQLQELVKNSGLLFVTDSSAENHYNNLVMIPRDVKHTIQRNFRRDERTLKELSRGHDGAGKNSARTEAAHPNVILDNTHNIVRDLVIFLSYAAHNQLKVLNNGGVGRNDLKKIVPLLSHNKTIKYVAFLALFAMEKKLLVPVGNRWRASKDAGDWFGNSLACFREMYEFWLNTNDWNEEYIEGDVLHVDTYPQNLIPIIELRKLILRVFDKTPGETWIDFGTFAESLLPQVAIEIPGRFDQMAKDKFNRHLLLIMESIIAESLYWFGITTLGVSDLAVAQELGSRNSESLSHLDWSHAVPPGLLGSEEFLFWFKISSTAQQMFGGKLLEPGQLQEKNLEAGLPYTVSTEDFTVQPNLEIIIPPDLNLSRLYHLLHFATVKKVDVMTTLSISRDSLRQGMQRGMTGQAILRFLREASRRELPETVVQLIEECDTRHGEVEIGYAGGYISAGDRVHIEEMRANPRISKAIKDVVDEKVIVLNRAVDLKRIAQEIQKMGFMAQVASDAVHVTGENLFHVTLRPEELYQLLAILQFAQGLEDESDGEIFEGDLRPLLERLGGDANGQLNPDHYVQPLLRQYQKQYEKLMTRQRDEEKRRLKKQVNRLLTRVPRRTEAPRYSGENPTSDRQNIVKLFKFAIENEMQVKIHYQRSTGEHIDEVIEPESMQGKRIYALCPEQDEHHIYVVDRIVQAAL